MSLFLDIKNALNLVLHGEWREFQIRWQVYRGRVDLKDALLDELKLSEERCYHYAHSGGVELDRVLRSFHIGAGDGVVDFGSGKGGVLITLSKHPFSRITGVEISPELARVARRNLEQLRIRNVEIFLGDAAEFRDLEEYNYFYFFNPFPAPVMKAVVENIKSSLLKRPRKVTLIYYNPECHDIIVNDTPFVKVREIPRFGLSYYIYSNDP